MKIRKIILLTFLFTLLTSANLNAFESDAALFESLYQQHLQLLHNTQIKQDPFVITFSAVPGMGKTFVAQQLQEHYNAVLISTNDVRSLIADLALGDRKYAEILLKRYMLFLWERYNEPNRRIILDASVDRIYWVLFPFFEKMKMPFVIIRLQTPPELVIDRIVHSQGDQAQNYLKFLDTWFKDYQDFGQAHQGYIPFANLTFEPLDRVIELIDQHIAKNKAPSFSQGFKIL